MSSARLADVKIELVPMTTPTFKAWHIPSNQTDKDFMHIFPNGDVGLFTASYTIHVLNNTFATMSSLRILNPFTAKVHPINLPLHSDGLFFIGDHLLLSDKKDSILFDLKNSTHKKTRWYFNTKAMFSLNKMEIAQLSPLDKDDEEDDKKESEVVSFIDIHDTQKLNKCEASLLYKIKLPNVKPETIVSIVKLENYLIIALNNGFVVALPKDINNRFSEKGSRVIQITDSPLNNLQLTPLANDRLLCYFYDIKTNKTQLHLFKADNLTTKNKKSLNKHLETSLNGKYNHRCSTNIDNQTVLFISPFAMHFIDTETLKKTSIILPNATLNHLAYNDDKIFMMYQKNNTHDKFIVSIDKKDFKKEDAKSAFNSNAFFNDTFKNLENLATITATEESNASNKPCCLVM